jgi:hypothetical protein
MACPDGERLVMSEVSHARPNPVVVPVPPTGPGRAAPVHPLDAPPEQKLFDPGLGRMALTFRVKMALFVLQGYLGIMALLVGWKLISGT